MLHSNYEQLTLSAFLSRWMMYKTSQPHTGAGEYPKLYCKRIADMIQKKCTKDET